MIKVVFRKPLMNSIKLTINKAGRVCKMHRHSNIKKSKIIYNDDQDVKSQSRCNAIILIPLMQVQLQSQRDIKIFNFV